MLIRLAPRTSVGWLVAAYALFGVDLGMVNPAISNNAVAGMPLSQAGVAAAIAGGPSAWETRPHTQFRSQFHPSLSRGNDRVARNYRNGHRQRLSGTRMPYAVMPLKANRSRREANITKQVWIDIGQRFFTCMRMFAGSRRPDHHVKEYRSWAVGHHGDMARTSCVHLTTSSGTLCFAVPSAGCPASG
jgi:hypothetical protein